MSAFNWILVETRIPGGSGKQLVRCQTHMASDYGGDESGRFHDRTYQLKERMCWWPKGHQKYENWKTADNRKEKSNIDQSVMECCYAHTVDGESLLYVVISFLDTTPVRVIDVGREEDWPSDYLR